MSSPDAEKRGRSASRWAWGVVLSLLAVLGNYIALSIGFNVDFIFGSVFGLLAVALLGPVPGVLVSLVGASYTIILWNHPYAVIIFGCEALWLAAVRQKKALAPIVIIDLAYWVLIGVPLVFLFYLGVMKLGITSTGTIALKQSLNGICNAVLASILLSYVPFAKWVGGGESPVRPYAQTLFESMAFILMIACMGELIYMNHRDRWGKQEVLAKTVRQSCQEAVWICADWLEQHFLAARALAREGREAGVQPSARLQEELEDILRVHPDFHNVFVADASATTVAFVPPVNERGKSTIGLNFSDREYFKRLKQTKELVVSDGFMGRGGIFKPIFTINAPIIEDGELEGFALGAVNLERLERRFERLSEQSGIAISLVDRKGNLVISSVKERKPLDEFSIEAVEGGDDLGEGVRLSLPLDTVGVPNVRRWQEATLFKTIPIETIGWTVIAEGPLAPLQESLCNSTIVNILAIFLLLVVTSGVSFWVSGILSTPLKQLSAVSTNLPERIESGGEVEWPQSNSLEVSSLIRNFKGIMGELQEKLHDLKAYGRNLEAAVAARTSELQKSEARLKEAQRIAHVGSWELDCHTKQVEWSDEVYRIFEVDADEFEVSYEGFVDMVHPEDREAVDNAYTDFLPLKTPQEIRHRLLLGDGRVKWVREQYVNLHGEDGAPLRSVGTVQDITEQTLYEQKLDAYAQSQRMLLKEVNHRVKNNLAMIVAVLNMEAREQGRQGCVEHLGKIVSRVNALGSVHSMLSSSEWQPIKIRDICLHVVAEPLREQKDATVDIAPSEVVVDASQAHNVALLMNELATNTAKHASETVPLLISIAISEEQGEVLIQYRDNGPGYPVGLLDGDAPHSGVGLQLLKGIVEMSLYGSLAFSNDNGAVTQIRFRTGHSMEAEDEE